MEVERGMRVVGDGVSEVGGGDMREITFKFLFIYFCVGANLFVDS